MEEEDLKKLGQSLRKQELVCESKSMVMCTLRLILTVYRN